MLGSCGSVSKAQEARFRAIHEIGCLACLQRLGLWVAPERDHLNLGGLAGMKRLGHDATIGLCCWHHRGIPHTGWTMKRCRDELGPSKHLEKRAFFAEFGRLDQLLAVQNRLLLEHQ